MPEIDVLPRPLPDEAADIIAINHLAVWYSDAVSRGEIDQAVLAYATDGILRSGTTADAVGREAIASLIKTTTSTLEFVFQTAHMGLVQVNGDTARARVQITEWARRSSDGGGLQFLGWYEDELRRGSDGWRYSSRTLVGRTLGRPTAFTGRIVPVALRAFPMDAAE